MTPVMLIVMDGWGVGEPSPGNATYLAETPFLDGLFETSPHTTLACSGPSVGLPGGQMGNSEVGHLTLGSGRVVPQDLTRINEAVSDGSFQKNRVLKKLIADTKADGGGLHLMGLVSDGGVHSHQRHLYAILEACKTGGLADVFIHAFLDGRDTPPESGKNYIEELVEKTAAIGIGTVASVMGRYWAMDRDKRWDRVRKAYDAIVSGTAEVTAEDPVKAIAESYKKGKTDEFMEPVVIRSGIGSGGKISDGDSVLFFNFRADRARELTAALTFETFSGFRRKSRPILKTFATMTEYEKGSGLPVLFAPEELENILAKVLCDKGIKQFRTSETEKYAHVTFFFNGGIDEPFSGEERLLIPSDRTVATYDLAPAMKAAEIGEAAAAKVADGDCGFMLLNFANGDMVGHTGVLDAAIKGCEAVDRALKVAVTAATDAGWAVLITSDHGNSEQMIDGIEGERIEGDRIEGEKSGGPVDDENPHTAHTTNGVPFIIVAGPGGGHGFGRGAKLRDGGGLADVAPTVLKIMGIAAPKEMTGSPLY